MSNIIEGLILEKLPEYELLQESDPEIDKMVRSIQDKVGVIDRMGAEYSLEKIIVSFLEGKNRSIDIETSFGRYLELMKRFNQNPKDKRTFRTSKSSVKTERLNSPFARFKEIERLGLEEGTKVLFTSSAETLESEVQWVTPICLVNLIDKEDPVAPWSLSLI
jgi:hypothetical protein